MKVSELQLLRLLDVLKWTIEFIPDEHLVAGTTNDERIVFYNQILGQQSEVLVELSKEYNDGYESDPELDDIYPMNIHGHLEPEDAPNYMDDPDPIIGRKSDLDATYDIHLTGKLNEAFNPMIMGLKTDMTDVEITALQRMLRIPATGIYDEFTDAAFRNYKLKNNVDE